MNHQLIILLQTASWNDVYNSANSLRSSVDNLCYILCSLFGLVGSIRIYNKWQLNDRCFNIDAEIAGWFGAALFFFVANTLIKQVF